MRRKLDKQKHEMETIRQKGYESEEDLKQKIGNSQPTFSATLR
jgi:hypothetical protein